MKQIMPELTESDLSKQEILDLHLKGKWDVRVKDYAEITHSQDNL